MFFKDEGYTVVTSNNNNKCTGTESMCWGYEVAEVIEVI